MSVQSFVCRGLHTVEEMLPHQHIVEQLGHGNSAETYRQYLSEMIPKGYSQMAVFKGETCIAIAGYFINIKLFSGKYVELDNVVVDAAHRSSGVGRILCKAIEEEGIKQGCKVSVLDAYVENQDAHRFYFREGYTIKGFHFYKKLFS